MKTLREYIDIIERVTFDPVTGEKSPSFADQVKAQGFAPAADKPGGTQVSADRYPQADSADLEAQTVTVKGQTYPITWLKPDGIRPRGGERFIVTQGQMGERGIGRYVGIIAGGRAFILPKGEQ